MNMYHPRFFPTNISKRKYISGFLGKLLLFFVLIMFMYSQTGAAKLSSPSSAKPVSILELISSPRKYMGKEITVTGYALTLADRETLFLTKEHSMMLDFGNAVYLEGLPNSVMDPLKNSCERKYVRVRGVFNKSKFYDDWVITEIKRIYEYDLKAQRTAESVVCWRKKEG